jgi:hypothetical protein
MAVELVRFLGGAFVLLAPGILLTRRLAHGACVGLALAVYLACALSQVNLRWFYPAWGAVLILSVGACWLGKIRPRRAGADTATRRWLILILLIVGVTRYAVALPRILPNGIDPASHLIMAKKIQLTEHAMTNWMPFDAIALNYPTGSHTLIAIMSTLTGLPLHTVYKDLIPLLGVLTTAQIYLFALRVTGDGPAALYAASAYGLWAGEGSVNYYLWGGLPNELGMLFFLALLTAWLEDWPWTKRAAVMSIELAGIILVHHHVLLVSGAVMAAALVVTRWPARRVMVAAIAGAVVLDAFFVVPYVSRAMTLASTHAWRLGEPQLRLMGKAGDMGYAYLAAAAVGVGVWLRRGRRGCNAIVICACVALVEMFIAFEYIWPMRLAAAGLRRSTAFLPSRFLNDLNYFLAVFAGLAIAFVQRRWRLARWTVMAAMVLIGATLWPYWRQMAAGPGVSPDFLAACQWIERDTSPDTIALSDNGWSLYLSWRRGWRVPASDSDPVDDLRPQVPHIRWIMEGLIPPDSPEMKIVQIVSGKVAGLPVLWRGESGLEVVQLWPR